MIKAFSIVKTDTKTKKITVLMTLGTMSKQVTITVSNLKKEADVFNALTREYAKYSKTIERV